ncbi:MAG TPA: DNA recombination protein RmuC [Steroidobacteraceae bacterium]
MRERDRRWGTKYVVQSSHTREDGTRALPDVILHLPEGRSLVIDSKVSLVAYENSPLQKMNWSARRRASGTWNQSVGTSFDRLVWLLDRVRDEVPDSEPSARMAIAHLCDLEAYLQKNASGIISYREWRSAGKRIPTSAVEGTVN